MELLSSLNQSYQTVWEHRDKRLDNYPLMSSFCPTVCLCVCYVFISKVLGPWFMKERQPMDIKSFLVGYNTLQIVLNMGLLMGGLFNGWLGEYSFVCQGVNFSATDPKALNMMRMAYCYYLTKILDFVDTFCFVAKKKFGHISLLHVFHHAVMPLSIWPGVRWAPGGHGSLCAMINAFVHVVMYLYYLLAAMGPEYKKYLWWKRHLTNIQISQFLVVTLQSTLLFFREECDFPWQLNALILLDALIFLALFAQFYIKEYLKKKPTQDKIKDN